MGFLKLILFLKYFKIIEFVMSTTTTVETSAFREPQDYTSEEKEDWDRLAHKMDALTERKPGATPFSREEMVRFCQL